MRIIGGRARGRRLSAPKEGEVRPTGDRVREALFNLLGQNLTGRAFLDVCSGSGAVALEALSRGAREAVAIECRPAFCRHIREQARALGLEAGLEVLQAEALDALARLRRQGRRFDVAFADPPWREEALRQEILAALFAEPPLCGLAVLEAPRRGRGAEAPPGAHHEDRRVYGQTALDFYTVAGQGNDENENFSL